MPINSQRFKEKAKKEITKVFILSAYFSVWFCALTFLATTSLDIRPIPLSIFGLALIKAALCAKFMIVGEALFPIKVNKNHGIIRSLILQSLLYLLIVIGFNYIEAGVHGLINGKNFISSMAAFGSSNPLHVFAMSIVYWLIVWPYLLMIGFKLSIGSTATLKILFGERSQSN